MIGVVVCVCLFLAPQVEAKDDTVGDRAFQVSPHATICSFLIGPLGPAQCPKGGPDTPDLTSSRTSQEIPDVAPLMETELVEVTVSPLVSFPMLPLEEENVPGRESLRRARNGSSFSTQA